MALRCVVWGGKQGKSCLQPETCIAQEVSSGPSAECALDQASAGIVMPAGLDEDSRECIVFHGGCPSC